MFLLLYMYSTILYIFFVITLSCITLSMCAISAIN
uniref:Uncharacterized protein n=1 Tax=Siphoviridae sp. cto6l14 TaxID=2827590 RepID=A0A8S5LPA7_9CAUD|nr:MAG TPA: hypothetical protein [Siphoviridae sp. cto6l14]